MSLFQGVDVSMVVCTGVGCEGVWAGEHKNMEQRGVEPLAS